MRYRLYGKNRNFSIFAVIKFVIFTFFFGTLIFGGFYTGSFIISYFTSSLGTIHPTSIPGIKDRDKCDKNGKLWHDDKCWDYQHNPTF